MANRLTQMDGEVPLILPSKVARERTTKEATGNIPTKASLLQKRDLKQKHHAFWEKPAASSHSKPDAAKESSHDSAQLVRNKSRIPYHEFMPLDQAGPAVIARNNTENGDFVAIKRMKRVDSKPVYTVPDFTSDHLVNIKDMFLEGHAEIVIIYEQMDVSLRHVMAVSGGPLQVFEIAAISREVSLTYNDLKTLTKGTTVSGWPLLYPPKAFTTSRHARLQHRPLKPEWKD